MRSIIVFGQNIIGSYSQGKFSQIAMIGRISSGPNRSVTNPALFKYVIYYVTYLHISMRSCCDELWAEFLFIGAYKLLLEVINRQF